MDGNFQLKRRKEKALVVSSDNDGIFAASSQEEKLWGTLEDVNEFAGEDAVSKEEVYQCI